MATGLIILLFVLLAEVPPEATPGSEPVFPVEGITAKVPQRSFVTFSHKIHADPRLRTKCTDCHRLSEDGNRFRPTEEKMCTPCHKADTAIASFKESLKNAVPSKATGPDEPIHRQHIYYKCGRCHDNMMLSEKIGDFPLPPRDNSYPVCVQCHFQAVQFSHCRHVKIEGKIAADCGVCHSLKRGTWYGTPGHAQCWRCHDIILLGLAEGCNLCHLREIRAPKTYNIVRADTLHKQHPRPKFKCDDCHRELMTALTLEEVRKARQTALKESCKRCHVDQGQPLPQ